MARNPPWTRDELILALDLYFRVNPVHTSEKNPEIVELSELLNSLPVHPDRPNAEVFRNPNGVYMKLCNYLRFDPSYEGKGLTAGGKLEEEIWEDFASDRVRLAATAGAIRSSHAELASSAPELGSAVGDEETEFSEGRVLTAVHHRRERNRRLVRRKKESVLEATGKLACEACGFDFEEVYGDLGRGFAECHHRVPLSDLKAKQRTRLEDLAILCANCHRMIHRSRPMLTVEELASDVGV